MVLAFSVQIPRAIEAKASAQDVPLYSSTIIYRIMEEVRNRVAALLPPIIERKVTGEANVLELFVINLKGRQTKQVAGCRVTNGLVEKSKMGRVIRDGVTVHEGKPIPDACLVRNSWASLYRFARNIEADEERFDRGSQRNGVWTQFCRLPRAAGRRPYSDVRGDRETWHIIGRRHRGIIISTCFLISTIPCQNYLDCRTIYFYVASVTTLFDSSTTGVLAPIVPVRPPTPKVKLILPRSRVAFSRIVQLRVSFFFNRSSTCKNISAKSNPI